MSEIARPLLAGDKPRWSFSNLRADLLTRVAPGESITELPETRFLNDQDEHELVVLCHMFRNGSLLARGYIEKIMGLPTGSDKNMKLPLNR